MYANTLKGCLLYWGQTNTLSQLKTVVFLACSGGETGHQTSCLLPGNLMGIGSLSTNTTTTSHWAFKMATWFTISALQPILVVLLTSVLMVCDSFSSNSQAHKVSRIQNCTCHSHQHISQTLYFRCEGGGIKTSHRIHHFRNSAWE